MGPAVLASAPCPTCIAWAPPMGPGPACWVPSWSLGAGMRNPGVSSDVLTGAGLGWGREGDSVCAAVRPVTGPLGRRCQGWRPSVSHAGETPRVRRTAVEVASFHWFWQKCHEWAVMSSLAKALLLWAGHGEWAGGKRLRDVPSPPSWRCTSLGSRQGARLLSTQQGVVCWRGGPWARAPEHAGSLCARARRGARKWPQTSRLCWSSPPHH